MQNIVLVTLFIGTFLITANTALHDEPISDSGIFKPWHLSNPPKISDFENVVIDSSPGWNGIDNELDDSDDDDDDVEEDTYRKPEKIDDLTLVETAPTADHDIVEDSLMTTVSYNE